MENETVIISISIGLSVFVGVCLLFLIRSVNQKCSAVFLMLRSDVLLGRLHDYGIRVNTRSQKRDGARRLLQAIESESENRGVLPETLLLVSLLNDIDQGLETIECTPTQLYQWVMQGERAGCRSSYMTAANDGDPEESLINVLNRFAKDVGKPMPRAILRVVSGKSDEDAVITLIDQLLESSLRKAG